MGLIGQGQEARAFRPERGGTIVASLAAVFGEANPAQVTDTPRTVGITPARAVRVESAPTLIANGWVDSRQQTGGMSTLYIDQIQRQPDAEIQGTLKSAINHSRYAPYVHQRSGHWLNARWDPIFRFANTAMDMRWKVGHIGLQTQGNTGQTVPGSAIMGPYAAPFRVAYQVPRFSTEPNTIVPQSSR